MRSNRNDHATQNSRRSGAGVQPAASLMLATLKPNAVLRIPADAKSEEESKTRLVACYFRHLLSSGR